MSELSDDELLALYRKHVSADAELAEAKSAFQGSVASKTSYAAAWCAESGKLRDLPPYFAPYVNYAAIAEDHVASGKAVFVAGPDGLLVFHPPQK